MKAKGAIFKFKADRQYIPNGGGVIRITKRTPYFVEYVVEQQPFEHSRKLKPTGRKKVMQFGDYECILVNKAGEHDYLLCLAG